MARTMSPEREKEYQELSGYINFFATAVWGVSPSDPCNAAIAERFGRAQALQGARQAANDTVEALRGRPVEAVRPIDEALRDAGLITFSEVSRRYGRTHQRILKRGKIATDTECYLVSGVVSDQTATISEAERAGLERILAEFEAKMRPERPRSAHKPTVANDRSKVINSELQSAGHDEPDSESANWSGARKGLAQLVGSPQPCLPCSG